MGKLLTAWMLGNGAAGAENQCLGLLQALRVSKFDLYRPPVSFWSRLPTPVHVAAFRVAGLIGVGRRADLPGDNFPDLIVSSGRAVSALSTDLRRASSGRSFSVHIQHPHCSLAHFDAVILPRHDTHRQWTSVGSVLPRNVIVTTGALNRIRPSTLPHDSSVVLAVGGSSRHIQLSPSALADVVLQLCKCVRTRASDLRELRVTLSRRTEASVAEAVRHAVRVGQSAGAAVHLWDPRSPHGCANSHTFIEWLSRAKAIVVTADSISMCSEACSTGKPVYTVGASSATGKLHRFHKELQELGSTREFQNALDPQWMPSTVLCDTQDAAEQVRAMLAARR